MRAWCGLFFNAGPRCALVAASLVCATAARSEMPPTPGGGEPAPAAGQSKASTKSLSDLAPKSIVVDPCKAQQPPPYCAKN